VVPAENQAHEHSAAHKPVDLTHEVEQQRCNEARRDGSDECLIDQVRNRQPADGEERQADPDDDDRQPQRLRVTSTTRKGDSRQPRGMSPSAQLASKVTIPAVTKRPITAPAASDAPAPLMSQPSPSPIRVPNGTVTARTCARVRHFSASVICFQTPRLGVAKRKRTVVVTGLVNGEPGPLARGLYSSSTASSPE
jgi:hypothetical protein